MLVISTQTPTEITASMPLISSLTATVILNMKIAVINAVLIVPITVKEPLTLAMAAATRQHLIVKMNAMESKPSVRILAPEQLVLNAAIQTVALFALQIATRNALRTSQPATRDAQRK